MILQETKRWLQYADSDLAELSFWAVESRYPSDLPDASQDDADTALATARKDLTSVKDDLRNKGLPE